MGVGDMPAGTGWYLAGLDETLKRAGITAGSGSPPPTSPTTSVPLGGTNLNESAGSRGLRSHPENAISVRLPRVSLKIIRRGPDASKPISAYSNCGSLLRDTSLNHSSPSRLPASVVLNSLSSCERSVSTVSGLCASSAPWSRTVTCSRSGSYTHTFLPSATISCWYGSVTCQRNRRGACSASRPWLEPLMLPCASYTVWLKLPRNECRPLAKASSRARAPVAAKAVHANKDNTTHNTHLRMRGLLMARQMMPAADESR